MQVFKTKSKLFIVNTHHVDADPDLSVDFNADPDPSIDLDADPD